MTRYDFNEYLFCRRFKHHPLHLEAALAILQNSGYITYSIDNENKARVMICVTRNELYNINFLTPDEEKALNALLRHYGTLFTDMTYIDNEAIMRHTALSQDELHMTLKSLAERRIIRYVPPRHMPMITYPRQRIDSAHMIIPKHVYETMQERMGERVSRMLQYIDDNTTCRERMLLEYFGKKTDRDCGHCDVCLG